MTNQIGTGTCNVSINLPRDERTELGRLAFQSGAKSVGDFLRGLVLRGLEQENVEAARRVREIRARYYGSALLTIFLASLALHPNQDLRRTGRRVRIEEVREEDI